MFSAGVKHSTAVFFQRSLHTFSPVGSAIAASSIAAVKGVSDVKARVWWRSTCCVRFLVFELSESHCQSRFLTHDFRVQLQYFGTIPPRPAQVSAGCIGFGEKTPRTSEVFHGENFLNKLLYTSFQNPALEARSLLFSNDIVSKPPLSIDTLNARKFSTATTCGTCWITSEVTSDQYSIFGSSNRVNSCGNVILRGVHRPVAKQAISSLVSFRTFQSTVPNKRGLAYHEDGHQPPRLLVVQPRAHPKAMLTARLYEALRLADSLEELRGEERNNGKENARLPPYVLVQSPELGKSKKRRKRIRADAYFGAGTIENIRAHVMAVDSKDGLDAVFVNATLSPVQQRNLERAWGKPVLDRVGLIIEIFGAHAESKEARLQVELAALNYKRSRLVRMPSKDGRLTFGMDFEAEVVSARGRGTGGRGFISGAGETEIQLQRRRISERKDRLLSMLAEVRRTRALHRASRQKHGATGFGNQLPVVAVVGYTNAGKSSLVAALSQSDLYIDDKLFATLDPRSRSVVLPSGQKVILSDTVGFISELPIQLVEAFHATLEEVVEADFLLHVIDSSAPNAHDQRITVLQVLKDLGVSKQKFDNCLIEVWNKVDLSETSSTGNSLDSFKLEESTMGTFLLPPVAEDELPSDEEDETQHVLVDDKKLETTENSVEEPVVIEGVSWLHDGIPRVSASAVEGIGLKELLDLLDKKLMSRPRPSFDIET